jgi:hypothetical protein
MVATLLSMKRGHAKIAAIAEAAVVVAAMVATAAEAAEAVAGVAVMAVAVADGIANPAGKMLVG